MTPASLLRPRLWLTAALCLASLPAAGVQDGAYRRVLRIDPVARTGMRYVLTGDRYTYSPAEAPVSAVPAGAPERTVLFGGMVELSFGGLKPGASYRVEAAFLSDSAQRRVRVTAGRAELEANLALPFAQVVRRQWQVPSEAYRSGTLDLRLQALAGPNAVVCWLEIWSTDAAVPTPPVGLASRLERLPTPVVRLWPRPSRVAGVRRPVMPLDGPWRFHPRPPVRFWSLGAAALRAWPMAAVPGEWTMQGFTVPAGQAAGYARRFDLPRDWAGKRVFLRFDSVQSLCRVFVNGHEVGGHEGGFVPFNLEVTRAVRPGVNSLALAVTSESTADGLASASQYAAHPLGGISRSVTLFALPKDAIAEQTTETRFDRRFRDADLIIGLRADAAGYAGRLQARLRLVAPDGRVAATSMVAFTRTATSGAATVRLRLRAPLKWDPEHPRLYRLTTCLLKGGRVVQELTERVGLRQIQVRGNRLLVNGRPVKLHGVNRHEVHPLLGRSLTPALCREDARLFRQANCNYIRTSHYPPSEAFLDACDELGLMVECEAPLCWVQHGANPIWAKMDHRDPALLPYLQRVNLENVAANRRHPSIILWSLANESLWTPLWARVLHDVKTADPTRPTSFHDQCWGGYNNAASTADIAVYHYPGETGPAACDAEKRPVLFGEYAHIETYNRREVLTDPGIRDHWGGPLARMVDLMFAHPGCLGGAIWSGIDDTFHLPGGRMVGYGPWGIIDGWRRTKPEYRHVQKAYSPVRVLAPEKPLPVGRDWTIAVRNRYDFADLAEVRVDWRLGSQAGTARCTAPPGGVGRLRIVAPVAAKAGQTLRLTFTDPRGFACDTEELRVGSGPAPTATRATVAVRLEETPAAFTVHSGGAMVTIDRTTGVITQATAGRRTVLCGGPTLMLLPLSNASGGDGGVAGNDFRAGIAPFNPVCEGWSPTSVDAREEADGGVTVTVRGAYAEASGATTLRFPREGGLRAAYRYQVSRAVDPRQWGLVFYAPAALDQLGWSRRGLWTTYPADHIARLAGTARANPGPQDAAGAPRGPWSADRTPLGTADFRGTKSGILRASLRGKDGIGFAVASDGSQAVRAFVDGQRIGLLVAEFNTGGADGFFAGHYASERKPLRPGDTLSGEVRLELGGRQDRACCPRPLCLAGATRAQNSYSAP